MATEQSAQQAANAANQQLQAGIPTTPGSIQGAQPSDSLTCQWAGCGDRATTPEQLYVSSSDVKRALALTSLHRSTSASVTLAARVQTIST